MSIPSAMASSANTPARVPPGFRFHPTDEELVDYYLKKKVESQRIDLDVIREIDLYKIEPWDLQERCRIGSTDQDEWYFFSHKDKKYPTGTRTNRATTAGFWKATGRDKAIYSKHKLVGMRKTLVFYKGRAPNGQKTDWIMHEYRLENCENPSCSVNAMPQPAEEGWAVCRVFKKRSPNIKALLHDRDPMMGGFCFEEQMCNFFGEGLESPRATTHVNSAAIANMMMATPKFLHQQQQISGSGLHYHHLNLGHRHHPEPIHGAGQDDLLVPYPFGSFNRNSLHDHHGSALQGVGTIGASIFACKQELDQLPDYQMPAQDSFMRLPQLESPKFSTAVPPAFSLRPVGGPPPKLMHDRSLLPFDNDLGAFMQLQRSGVLSPSQTSTTTCTNVCSLSDDDINKEGSIAAVPAVNNQAESITDWRVLDRLVASQLSQDIPVEKSPCARLSMASPFDAQYGCNSMANADPDQQCATPSDGSDKQPSSTPSSSMSQPASSNYNPSNDIDLWSFAKRDLVSDHI